MKRLILTIGCLCVVFTGAAQADVDTAWVRTYNGPGNGTDEAKFIGIDAAGYIYVTGTSVGVASGSDVATFKYDPITGDTLWLRRFEGVGTESQQAYGMHVDASGNVYVLTTQMGLSGYQQPVTIKYDTNGDTIWVGVVDRWSRSYPRDLFVDNNGRAYVAGYYLSTIGNENLCVSKYAANGSVQWMEPVHWKDDDIDWVDHVVADVAGNVYLFGDRGEESGNDDFLLIKFDSDGDTLWERTYNSPYNRDDDPMDMCIDASGNVYVTGTSYESLNQRNCVTIKYSPDGDVLWESTLFEGTYTDEARRIVVDDSGYVYVLANSDLTETTNNWDWLVIKYDASGDTVWTRRYAGVDGKNDVPYQIFIDQNYNFYVTGDVNTLSTGFDCMTVKFNHDGDTVWSHRYTGPGTQNDIGYGVVADAYNDVYVTGRTTSSTVDYLTMRITEGPCDCPSQGDVSDNGVVDMPDMTAIHGIAFLNGSDIEDPDCRMSRADWDGSKLVDCRDVSYVMAHLFAGGQGPSDPCTCPPGPPGVPCSGYSDDFDNAVIVTSKTAVQGETGVSIPILLQNPTSNLRALTVPLVIREVDPGSYVTSLALSYGDRLAPLMAAWAVTNHYALDDGSCGASGFETVSYSDGASHPVAASPEGAMFSWGLNAMMPQPLTAGSDVTGSLILTVDVTATLGQFEIDTACCDPGNHLLFVYEDWTGVRPLFTKGTITIQSACDCPHQSDFDEDGYLTAVDLSRMIDLLFAGQPDVKDPSCPSPRADFDCDGYSTATDLAKLIDHLFAGDGPPGDPCVP